MRDALEAAGYQVFELPSAIGSTREVLRHDIDVVVIDLNMPAMRGDSLARLFRANPRMRSLRLVLVSGSPAHQLESIAGDVRADAWVHKESLPAGLVDAVATVAGSSP